MPDDSFSIDVYFLPRLFEPQEVSGKTVVVFDVLRATSVMIESLANGAKKIIACASIEQAIHTRQRLQGDRDVLLGGERNGLKIDGFDMGNSPCEVVAETVANQTIIMTTTNGTVAIGHCHQADEIMIGAFFNLSALANQLQKRKNIALVCSGTGGEITGEDVLAAGAVVDLLMDNHLSEPRDIVLNDQAQLARSSWQQFKSGSQSLVDVLQQCKGGKNLLRHGKMRFEKDIERAAEIDRHSFVPVLNDNNEIVKPALPTKTKPAC